MKPNHQLRHERELRGWSQQKIAEMVGTTPRTVSRWELGLSRPYPHFREQLCILFEKNATALGLLDDEELAIETSSPSAEEAGSPTINISSAEERTYTASSGNDLPDIYDPTIPPPLAGQSKLIGRDKLLEQVKQQLQVGERVAITALNGLPGVGKTALAIALATDPAIKARFRDGILWAGLGPEADVQGLLRHWGLLLGLTPEDMSGLEGTRAWTIALRRAIGQRRMLLVIDDAWRVEHVLALQVGGLFCSYVVTTRLAALAAQVTSEGVIVVPELDEEDGIALLNRFIPEIVNQEPETARELVNLVGGLPLAQVLIGRHLHAQSMSKQPRRLQRAVEQLRNAEQRLRIAVPASPLSLPANLAQESPWSLQATIAVSDQQLDKQARNALRALSVFPAKPNSFSEDAALAVCQVPVEVLDTLSDGGLLESWGIDYYTLHQTIADYARVHLNDQRPYENLIDYYITYIEANKENLQKLISESVNIIAALDVACRFKLREKHVKLFTLFAHFALRIKETDVYEKYAQRAYEAAQAIEDVDGIPYVLLHVALSQERRGEYERSEETIQQVFKLVQRSQDHPMLGLTHAVGSRIAMSLCDYPRAEEHANTALTLGLQKQDRFVVYLAYTALAWVAASRGKYQEMESYAEELLKRARQDKSHEFMCFGFLFLSQKKISEGDYIKAHEYAQESFDYADTIHYDEFTCQSLELLSQSERLQGKYQQAHEHVEQGLKLAQKKNIVRMIGVMYVALGELFLAQGKIKEAENVLRDALEIIPELLIRLRAGVLYGLARVEVEKGNLQIARQYAEESLKKLTAIGHYERAKVSEFIEQKLNSNNSEECCL